MQSVLCTKAPGETELPCADYSIKVCTLLHGLPRSDDCIQSRDHARSDWTHINKLWWPHRCGQTTYGLPVRRIFKRIFEKFDFWIEKYNRNWTCVRKLVCKTWITHCQPDHLLIARGLDHVADRANLYRPLASRWLLKRSAILRWRHFLEWKAG